MKSQHPQIIFSQLKYGVSQANEVQSSKLIAPRTRAAERRKGTLGKTLKSFNSMYITQGLQ